MTGARSTRALLIGALILGVAADLLFDAPAPSLGAALSALAVLAFTLVRLPAPRVRLLLVLMGVTSLLLVLRSTEALNVFSVAKFVGCGLTAFWLAADGAVVGSRAWDLLRAVRSAVIAFIVGAGRLVARSGDGEATARSTKLSLVLAGAIIALPILAVTATLLAKADPVFGRGLATIVEFISEDFIRHAVVSAVLAGIVAGWLQGVLYPAVKFTESSEPPRFALAAHLPALLGFTVLLAAFLGVQARAAGGIVTRHDAPQSLYPLCAVAQRAEVERHHVATILRQERNLFGAAGQWRGTQVQRATVGCLDADRRQTCRACAHVASPLRQASSSVRSSTSPRCSNVIHCRSESMPSSTGP